MNKPFYTSTILSIALGMLITVFVFSDLAYGGGDLYEQLDRPVLSQIEQLDTPSSIPVSHEASFPASRTPSVELTSFSYFLPFQVVLTAELKASSLAQRSDQLADRLSHTSRHFLFPVKRGLSSEVPDYS